MINRNYLKSLFLVVIAVAFCSCNDTSRRAEQPKTYEQVEAEFRATLTKADTTIVLHKADSMMQALQKGDLESALSGLYMLTSEGVSPLNAEKLTKLTNHFKRFPVVDYKLLYFNFSTRFLNDLKYSIQFVKDDQGQTPSISFMFNPCKIDGTWYLCVKDEAQSSSDLKNPIHPKTPVHMK